MWLADIEENLRFLVMEATRQVEDARRALATLEPDAVRRIAEKVAERDDYIDTLKAVIENKCFSRLGRPDMDRPKRDTLHAINVIATNLERIGDYAAHLVGQLGYLPDPLVVAQWSTDALFGRILDALNLVMEAVTTRDVNIALKICRSEFEVDREYGQHFTDILAALTNGGDPPALVTVLFMFKNLEEIGDALLNIGEALIFAVFGEKLKVHQYHALGEALDASGDQLVDTVHRFESIWGTRSGCRIGRVPSSRAPVEPENPGRFVIFKEGKTRKLAKERDSLERWNRLQPGLVPQVVGFHEHGENASLLLEFIPGRTLQTLLLEAPDQLPAAYSQLENVLTGVWRQTRRDEPTDAAFVSQLGARLDDVFRVHPAFARPGEHIGSLVAPSFTDLLQDIRRVTAGLVAPLSVMIHGDLNLDNIMFEPESGTLHFIDLHRSAQTDYAQDVSVLMVSHFRRPVFDPVIRDRLTAGIHTVLDMALRFAAEVGDRTIEARMALGLVRSFFTSTRFELDEDFARAMLLRAVYLLRKLIAHAPRPWELFRLPTAVFSYP